MRVVEALENAYEIIKDKQHWTTGKLATDAAGNSIDKNSDKADKFCAIGSIYRVTVRPDVPIKALQLISKELFNNKVESVNDSKGHEAVCKLFETAIARWKDKDPTVKELNDGLTETQYELFVRTPT